MRTEDIGQRKPREDQNKSYKSRNDKHTGTKLEISMIGKQTWNMRSRR